MIVLSDRNLRTAALTKHFRLGSRSGEIGTKLSARSRDNFLISLSESFGGRFHAWKHKPLFVDADLALPVFGSIKDDGPSMATRKTRDNAPQNPSFCSTNVLLNRVPEENDVLSIHDYRSQIGTISGGDTNESRELVQSERVKLKNTNKKIRIKACVATG